MPRQFVIARKDGEFFQRWEAQSFGCCLEDCEHFYRNPSGFTDRSTRYLAKIFTSKKRAEGVLSLMLWREDCALVELVESSDTFEETWRPSAEYCADDPSRPLWSGINGHARPSHEVWERGPHPYVLTVVPNAFERLTIQDPLRLYPECQYTCRTCGYTWERTVPSGYGVEAYQ